MEIYLKTKYEVGDCIVFNGDKCQITEVNIFDVCSIYTLKIENLPYFRCHSCSEVDQESIDITYLRSPLYKTLNGDNQWK